MRSPKDRRTSHATDLFTTEDTVHGQPHQERRHKSDRRLENLTLEERQLQLSEMPSPESNKPE
jgi:hypothetical protein